MTGLAPPARTAPGAAGVTLPAAALLRRSAAELAKLAALCNEVQAALSLCRFSEPTDPRAIRGLQGLDRLTQCLDDLARLQAGLAQMLPETLAVDAEPLLAGLRLRELVERLDPACNQPPPAESGDVSWL